MIFLLVCECNRLRNATVVVVRADCDDCWLLYKPLQTPWSKCKDAVGRQCCTRGFVTIESGLQSCHVTRRLASFEISSSAHLPLQPTSDNFPTFVRTEGCLLSGLEFGQSNASPGIFSHWVFGMHRPEDWVGLGPQYKTPRHECNLTG